MLSWLISLLFNFLQKKTLGPGPILIRHLGLQRWGKNILEPSIVALWSSMNSKIPLSMKYWTSLESTVSIIDARIKYLTRLFKASFKFIHNISNIEWIWLIFPASLWYSRLMKIEFTLFKWLERFFLRWFINSSLTSLQLYSNST